MECPVCLGGYNSQTARPLFLPCGHTLCCSCIAHLVQNYGALTCPTCQQVIPASETAVLPTNFSLLDSCSRPSAALSEGETSDLSEASCSLHPDKKVKFHCVNCSLDFCSRCVTLHSGDNHKIEGLSLAVDRNLDALLRTTSDLETKLEEGKSMLEQLRTRGEMMEEVRKDVESAYAEALVQLQTERESTLALLSRVCESNASSLSAAQLQLAQLSSQLSQVQAQLRPARHSVSSASLKRASLAKAETLLQGLTADKCRPNCRLEVGKLDVKPMVSGIVLRTEQVESGLKEERKLEETPGVEKKVGPSKAKGKKYDPVWWYMTDANTWAPYTPGLSRQIEHAYMAQEASADLGRHLVDFTRLIEVNKKTGKQRKVGREIS